MLRIACGRGGRWGERFSVLLGDALALPLPDESCDALGCAFGVRNLTDVRTGFREFHRVLRPGGALAILEFTPRSGGLPGRAVAWYVKRAVPAVGRLISSRPEAYRYLAGSVASFHGPGELAQIIRGAGFRRISQRPLSFGACTLFTAYRSPSV